MSNKKAKSLRLLQNLNKVERKALVKFLHSEYFKVPAPCIRLFEGLQQYAPNFEEAKIDKAQLWEKLYPEKPYSLKILTNKMSDLNKEIERFLVIQSITQTDKSYLYKHLKAKTFNRHVLYDDFAKEVQNLITEKEDIAPQNLASYRELADLYHTFYFHPDYNKITTQSLFINKIWKNNQNYSLLSNLICAVEILTRTYLFKETCPQNFTEIIEQQINLYEGDKPLIIQVYIQLYQLLRLPSASFAQYKLLENLILENLAVIDAENKEILLLSVANYLSKLINAGKTAYKERFFSIYQTIYEQGIFTKSGAPISDNVFLNMISFGARYSDLAWLEDFIKNVKLSKTNKDKVVQLGWCYYFFETEQYNKAAKQLATLGGGDVFFKTRIRSLEVRIHYELAIKEKNDFTTFYTKHKSFVNFIRNSATTINGDKKAGYRNFLKLLYSLARLKDTNKYTNSKQQLLINRLNSVESILFKSWLKTKIME